MNKKIILAILSIAIIVGALLAGFLLERPAGALEKSIKLYFLNDSKTSIEVEEKTIDYNNPDELTKLVIEALIKGPRSNGLRNVTGKSTKLLGVKHEDLSLTVDFSKEFLREDIGENMLSVYAIAKTLCQIDKVTSVQVTVDGLSVLAADGSPIGFLANRDINLESDMYNTDSKNITLYFASKDGTKLEKEVRTIKITDTRPIESYVISELIKGPVNKELNATLTGDTELISAETTNGTCHVTFKNFIEKNLSDPTGGKSVLAVYSVVNSLTALEGVSNVRFLFEGKTAEMVGSFNFADVFEASPSLQ